MTLLGMPFEKAAYSFGWGNMRDFARNLPQTSATYRALHEKESEFLSPLKHAAMIADVYDAISGFSHMFAKAHGGKGQRPDPYPRPWAKKGESFGSDPIPIADFNDWYYGGE